MDSVLDTVAHRDRASLARRRFRFAPILLAVGGMLVGASVTFALLYSVPGKTRWNKTGGKVLRWLERTPPKSGASVKSWTLARGLSLAPAASGFDFPVRIVFHPTPPTNPGEPFYYVAELGGTIKVVKKDGQALVFAENLLNFKREPLDEAGLLGLAYDAEHNQFFAAMAYWDEAAGVLRNKVDRLGCSPDGLRMVNRETILDMKNEATTHSYQIQFCALGPEDLLYVGVGSGAKKSDAQDMTKFAGKILRMEKDGRASPANPYFDPDHPDAPRSYIYAYGMRNPYDIAWDPRSGVAVVTDVGPGLDRLLRLEAGVNYCFRNDDDQMRANALFTWGPPQREHGGYAPVGVTFVDGSMLGFERAYDLCVGLFGHVHIRGPNNGKRVSRFRFNLKGTLDSAAEPLVTYAGAQFSSITDVECGPDGLYFLDIYGETAMPHHNGGVVYRLQYDPNAASVESGEEEDQMSGPARGRFVFNQYKCHACHQLGGSGGGEGPPLVNLRDRLGGRLNSPGYEESLRRLMGEPGAYFREQQPRYEKLLSLRGDDRIRGWLHYHIRDPRFDNPRAKMPSHDLSDAEIDALAAYLLEQ